MVQVKGATFSKLKSFKEPKGIYYKGKKYTHYSNLPINESAIYPLSFGQGLFFIFAIAALLTGAFFNWHLLLVYIISALTILYFLDLLFNLFIVYRSFFTTAEITIRPKMIGRIDEKSWPTYTILCPLYKETGVFTQFVSAIDNLSYPKDRLQVLLLLEEDDKQTIRYVRSTKLSSFYEVVIVPNGQPKTKPKALNYGLLQAQGEYIVVYDAEDIPDVLQLKKVVLAFRQSDKNTVCMQAKLNFYNPHQNILTRLFALEYSLWFDLVLTGLQSIHAPIPLGGTSNHFKTADLKKINGWDGFNVTEDADLGVRLAKYGYQTAMVNSYTLEEANSKLANWFWQRTRWVKGYMQTYLVHTRKPLKLFMLLNWVHFVTFQLIVGGKVLSMLINPIMWIITILYFSQKALFGSFIESLFIAPIFYVGVFSLFAGNFLYMYYYILGSAKRSQWELIPYSIFTPFYWLIMSFASYFALCELVFRPHYWHKTIHGMHLSKKGKHQYFELLGIYPLMTAYTRKLFRSFAFGKTLFSTKSEQLSKLFIEK